MTGKGRHCYIGGSERQLWVDLSRPIAVRRTAVFGAEETTMHRIPNGAFPPIAGFQSALVHDAEPMS